MMIQDEELRSLYQTTGLERLQKLQMGLMHLEQAPKDQTVLEELRREIHSLKGDSRIVGLEDIVNLSQQIEDIVKAIQHNDVAFTLEVSDRLYHGLEAAGQLVHEAATGEQGDVDFDTTFGLLGSVLDVKPLSSERLPEELVFPQSPGSDIVLTECLYIDDDELREIYRTTSEDRLQALEISLSQLIAGDDDPIILETLRRETHSLKGDSKAVGLDILGELVQGLEDITKAVQQQPALLTPMLGEGLDYGLGAIRQLVEEAVSGEPSGIDAASLGEYLMELTDSVMVPRPSLSAPSLSAASLLAPEASPLDIVVPEARVPEARVSEARVPETKVPDLSPLDIAAPGAHPLDPQTSAQQSAPIAVSVIEDAELREIYRTTTEERLQSLEANLLYLEKYPQDETTFAALLREAHSLKGDSRSTGVDSVEAIAHAVEDVLIGVQRHHISLDSGVSDSLYRGLDAMGQLAQEAVTGEAAGVDTAQLLQTLQNLLPINDLQETAAPTPEISAQLLSTEPAAPASAATPIREGIAQIDSIRVQTRELDTLLSQAEELAVTRIQIAQSSTQVQQLVDLWEAWQSGKKPLDPSAPAYPERMEALLQALRTTVQDNSSKLDLVAEDMREQVRKLQLLPLSTLFQPLPRLVRDLAKQQAKKVELVLEGEDATADKRLLEGIKDSLMHLVRNAIDHGIETPEDRLATGKPATATLRIKAYQTAISLTLEISDDGKGLDLERIKQTAIKRGLYPAEDLEAMSVSQLQRLILAPGFSTRTFITEISGRGVGLDVVNTQVERLKGGIQIESTPGQGCTFRLQMSTALSTANVILVETQGMTFALPIEFLQMSLLVSPDQLVSVDGRQTLDVAGEAVPVADLAETLELSSSPIYDRVAQPSPQINRRPCVLLKIGEEQAGFFVDRLITQQEVVSKPLGTLLNRVRNVSGATILGTGEVCMILNPSDLLKSLQRKTPYSPILQAPLRKSIILLVEDSPPVRIQEKRLFEGAGYEVVTAVNGLEGYNKLRTRNFDAVVSDVEMPHLDGFSLVARIRQHQEYEDLPVVLVTTLDSDADRKRGADAGASAYIIKGRFNQEALLETLEQLI
ncbi:MAG: Hpt domain-containing protein [Elainellaceae cyanobacterium]